MSTLVYKPEKDMWWNKQTHEWWKVCEVCGETKHLAKYKMCMTCRIKKFENEKK